MDNLDQSGQHYMIDKKLVQFIVDAAGLKKTDVVLEVGYGKGVLTKELAKKCRVIAVDIEKGDVDASAVLIQGNILDEFEKLESKYAFNKIVSNIPYSISEPLMRCIFKSGVESCVLTVGRDFSEILMKKDNRIGILAGHLYNIGILKSVSPKSFSPMPRVDSCVIRFEKKPGKISELYRKLLFLDNKKLKNALESIIRDRTKREIGKIAVGKMFDKKLYELSNEEFIELDRTLVSFLL
jgi:16S rRNA (adenine1518-N6/adenine1519-N6)-dimethyltransferase